MRNRGGQSARKLNLNKMDTIDSDSKYRFTSLTERLLTLPVPEDEESSELNSDRFIKKYQK